MSLRKSSAVAYTVLALLIGLGGTFPAFAHSREDAHSAPELPQGNVPLELVSGTVVRMLLDNRLTDVTTQYVALRGGDGQRIALSGKSFDAFPNGAHAEVIGWRKGSTFAVSDMRAVAMPKAETLLAPASALEVEGTLLLAHLDFLESGRGEYLYTVRDDAGRMTHVNLISGDGLAPGMRVIAAGSTSADGRSLDVTDLTIVAAAPPKARDGHPVTQAAINNVLVVLLKFTDSPASDPFTQAQVQDVMTNATTGVAQYYNEVSYGRQTLNITVTNWLVGRNPSGHAPMATPPSCDFDTMGTYGDTAASDAGYTGSYQNRFYVMPPNAACGFSGVAYIGGDTAWSNGVNNIKVYAHELGHNFGLYHAASLTCAGASIGGTCTSTEYGDPFDVMGNISSMHFNSMQKAKLGWIPATSVKTQGPGSQQYTLDAMEIASGSTYAVTVPIAANPNRTYWIEYRQPIGFDGALSAGNANGAQIRVASPFETCTGCQFFLGLQVSDDTELLDMTAASTPGAFDDARLPVGSTFTDTTYGITIQVLAADPAHLTLNVTTPGGSKTSSTTTLASTPNPAAAGSSVTFTATVTGSAPTGSVMFTDGGAAISGCGAVTLTGAGNTRTAACSTTSLSAGTHNIVAAYAGDGSNTTSSSVSFSQVINAKTASTTAVASGTNPSMVGANVTFIASVTGSAPTGTVNFTDGGTSIGGCGAVALSGSGNIRTATCSTAVLAAGTHNILATYQGDAANAASSSVTLSQVVNASTGTTTGLVSAINPSIVGATVTFTASVTGNAPTGTVRFTDGGTAIAGCAAVALTGAGNTRTAACGTAALSAGTHAIAASYAGDGSNTASNSTTLSQTVNPKTATTTALASSANPSLIGTSVTFSASVTGSSPTGALNFTDGGATIAGCGSVALAGSGNSRSAVCTSASLGVGTHSIVASYGGDGANTASSSAVLSQVVNDKTAATASVVSSVNPSIAGANVTFTASVTGTAPTGSVSFTDAGSTVAGCGAVALAGTGNTRTAACSTSALTVGTHTVVATYAGDSANTGSISPVLAQVVNAKAVTTTALVSSINPSVAGASVTFTASVTGNAPGGSVSFTDGGTGLAGCGSVALIGSGNTRTAVCSTAALTIGTHAIAAGYAGDAGNAASGSATLSEVVNKPATATTLASSANPSVVGANVNFTATSIGSAPTGSVSFTDGGVAIAGCAAVALSGAGNSRTAICSVASLTAGTHSIAAAYSGDTANAASGSTSLSQVVNRAATTTGVGSSANPSIAGVAVTFTATISGSAPIGTVSFADAGTTIAGCAAAALTGAGNTRTATCSTSALTIGTHGIVAAYSGDAGNSASGSATLSQVVNKPATGTTLASSANPSIVGLAITFTATVSGSAPTGTVSFTNGGTTITGCGAAALAGAGNARTATCTTSALTLGTHGIVAGYSGDAANGASSSVTLSQTVNARSSTTTAVGSSADPSIVGANVNFTATITGSAPTGTVSFSDGGAGIAGCATVVLGGAGNSRTAVCSAAALTAGTHSIAAAYSGDVANAASSSTVLSQVVNRAATTTALSTSPNPSIVGTVVTFSALVAGNAPTGTVNFTAGGATLANCGAVVLTGTGNTRAASCTSSSLAVGPHSIVAVYSGDAGNAASSSVSVSQTVNAAGSTAALATSANPSIAGRSVTFTATVSGTSPTGTVSFASAGTSIAGCSAVALTGTGNTRTAACTTSSLTTGSHSIVAAYSGSSTNAPASSAPLMETITGPAPVMIRVSSRKVHGSAGTFDLPLSTVATNPTSEPRLGPAHSIVFTFDKPISSATVKVLAGVATAAAPTFSGNSVIVNLTGVSDIQYVSVALSNVTATDGGSGGAGSVRIGFLAGDVSQNRVVSMSDVAQMNAVLAQPVTASNYLKDVNASGTLTTADRGIVGASLAKALPAP
jgi:hypothetical protein